MVQKTHGLPSGFVKRLAVRLLIAGVAATLFGCAGNRTQPAKMHPQPIVDKVAEQQQRLRQNQPRITALLQLAERALARDHLMQPPEDNAFLWYRQVIDLDELNRDAHGGMHRITQRYLQLAEQAFQAARPDRAELMLKRALSVAATPAQAEAVREQYRGQLQDKVFPLSVPDLNARNDALQRQLAQIARLAREKQSRLLIVAHSDAEGRWIYKQMRAAVDGFRLRGNIETGEYPRVVLIDL